MEGRFPQAEAGLSTGSGTTGSSSGERPLRAGPASAIERSNASIRLDLAPASARILDGFVGHPAMLGRCGVISLAEADGAGMRRA